ELPAAQDRLLRAEGELAVRARADPEIVAEAPVVEVVRALPARPRVGAGFVLRVTGIGQHRLAGFLDVPGRVVVRYAARRARREHRVGLQGELVVRDVRRRQRDGAGDV